jgi:hypothetical protein
MTKKNLGPCAVKECNKPTNRFRTFTINCKRKAIAKETYNNYHIEVGFQLCHSHYLEICEPDRYTKYNKLENKAKIDDKENYVINDRNFTNRNIHGKLKIIKIINIESIIN